MKDTLNPKDFRIGNYLEPYSSGKPFQITIDDLIIINNGESRAKLIPLTEEWLLKFGFENWGKVHVNEHESYIRFVLYNVLGGTSNYEVHFLTSNYGAEEYKEIIYSIDDDEPQHVKETAYVHNLQNHYFLVAGYEINE